jgi:phosphatidyl-myo-inositol dimannoside synthase
MTAVLFLTRSWHGHGGMQRWSRDFSAEMGSLYGMRFRCEHPQSGGRSAFLLFVLRSLRSGWQSGRQGWRIHLGDCALLPLGVLLQWCTGTRLSVTACGLDVVYRGVWYQRMLRWCLPFCDRVVCISDATAREVAQRGVSGERIVVIPCGLSQRAVVAPRPSTSQGSRTLVTIGRLVPRKGVAWFLERVFPALVEMSSDLSYVIVGDGPERARIASVIHAQGLSRYVTLCGALTDAERDALLAHADVFLMPNVPVAGDMEGFGIVCIEAAAHGVPVVAARLDGIPDAVQDGETGRLFAPGDAHDCQRMIRAVLEESFDREAVAEAAWNRFGWPTLIHRYQALVFHD